MKRIGVLTSGGDSPGMNAGIRAVVRAAIYYDLDVWGIQRGYQGLIDRELQALDARDVSGIISHGGTMLRSARCKRFYDAEGRSEAAAALRDRGIEGLVVIGGDGSYKGASLLEAEHGIKCVGMPGTIDNDIGGTDFTIGYDTALNTAVEAIDRIRDTAASHDRLFFIEVMGRDSGFLAMMSAIAGGAEEVLVPEFPTDIDRLIGELRRGRDRGKTSSIVIVAEGDDQGGAFAIAQKVGELSEFKDTRVVVIGHLQRGGQPTAYDRILAGRLGVRAVQALREGASGVMVGIHANQVVLNPFQAAWEQRTKFDPSYIQLEQILAT